MNFVPKEKVRKSLRELRERNDKINREKIRKFVENYKIKRKD